MNRATPDERDAVSSRGWAFGYTSGALVLVLNLVLFSGTDDKLQAAAVLTAGAAALGKPVNVFLQYWALDAFRADRIQADHGLAGEAGVVGANAVRRLARRWPVSAGRADHPVAGAQVDHDAMRREPAAREEFVQQLGREPHDRVVDEEKELAAAARDELRDEARAGAAR